MQKNTNECFLTWLSYLPSLETVGRGVVVTYLEPFGCIRSSISYLNADGAFIILNYHGSSNLHSISLTLGSAWQPNRNCLSPYASSWPNKGIGWCDSGKTMLVSLFAHGVLIGVLVLEFEEAMHGSQKLTGVVENMAGLLSLYLVCKFPETFDVDRTIGNGMPAVPQIAKDRPTEFSKRQVAILGGLAENKTNNAIAHSLGFSLSTIRQEVSRIFVALEVSSRAEAVEKALILHHLGT